MSASAWLALRFVLAASLLIPAACGGGGSSGPGPSGNQVTLLATGCPGGTGTIPNSECLVLEVDVVGQAPLEVDLRITDPDPGTTELGTAILCSGGGGTEYYEEMDGGVRLIGDLTAQGLRVVQRRWRAPWVSTSSSLREQSERFAELSAWIRGNIHMGGIFCAVGNSGGAGEIAYTLSTWNAEALLDRAILCSGPSFSRLDYLCLAPSALWATLCPGIVPPGALTCGTPPCMQAEGAPLCTGILPQNATAIELEADSILHPGADLDYPGTLTYVLIGSNDCSVWTPQGLLFHSQLSGPNLLHFVPGGEHSLSATEAGRLAIVQAVLGLIPATAASPDASALLEWVMIVTDGEPPITGWRHVRSGR